MISLFTNRQAFSYWLVALSSDDVLANSQLLIATSRFLRSQ